MEIKLQSFSKINNSINPNFGKKMFTETNTRICNTRAKRTLQYDNWLRYLRKY